MPSAIKRLVCLCSLFYLGVMMSSPARAQQSLGSITGTAMDSSGAVIPGAKVKVLNPATGFQRSTETNGSGAYQIFDLPIGTYTVTFAKEGFKTEVHSTVIVQANRTATVGAVLQPGAVSTTITVEATPLMNQVDTTNGYVLSSSVIEAIPLGTGSFTQLAVLSPGVNSDLLAGAGTNAGLGNQNIFANGQRDTSNSFTFNSVTSNNLFNGMSGSSVGESRFVLNTNEQFLAGGQIQTNTSVFDAIGQGLPSPPPETIEEIHVNTSMYDASQGASSGAHVEVTTKSGTNEFHGGAYEYHQESGWNASPFFFNAANLPNPPLHRNTFGGTLGGPIKKDKLFFFGSYQGQRVTDATSGSTEIANVPTGLTDDRNAVTLAALAGVPVGNVDSAALAIMQAKNSKGQLIVPSQSISDPNQINLLGGNAIETGPPQHLQGGPGKRKH